jgi:hypothetical protein
VEHHDPPEVAWLLPEDETGAELELKPDDPVEVPDPVELPDPVEVPEVPDPVDDVPEELEFDFAEDEDDEVSVLWMEPGSTSATAPAAATLARLTAVVAERTLDRPRSLAATATRTSSRCALFMSVILRSGTPDPLHVPSGLPLRLAAGFVSAPRLGG